jgi:glutamate-5-semialdehyde dehydrogenase
MSWNGDGLATEQVRRICERARVAARRVARLESETKVAALIRVAESIRNRRDDLKDANQKDLKAGRAKGRGDALMDRLELTDARIDQMVVGIEEIAGMSDPVGEVVSQWNRPGGFEVGRVRIPLGVIGIVYESRPNVTADASALSFKAGNATILRGGSEAISSNLAIVSLIRDALEASGVDHNAVQMIETTEREAVGALLKQNDLVDVIIPRGGKGLIRRVVEESTIPVIKHFEGICHVYIHSDADIEMALAIAVNAKVQRPSTCNSMETLLVDESIASGFLPKIASEFSRFGVKIYGCSKTAGLIAVDSEATAEDFSTEYLGLICNIRVVAGIDEAIDHIETYGSNHTDAIVTQSYSAARRFTREVDSSSVMVNASTRLADGALYGLGAEIGISTDKLHAFGPMGVKELTTKKFVVRAEGALR